MLTFGSLFSGIGGIDLGLERAGMRCAWQVEIDDYATRVLQKHWPDVPRFCDVRECGAHNLGAVDLIAGGFPCQDISFAGTGAGIDGARSGLWSEFARLIGELRPRYAVVENVSALLVRGMGRVLGDLAALGYDAEWEIISACSAGAPHTRERLFIVAHPHSQYGQAGVGPFSHRAITHERRNDSPRAGFWLVPFCGSPRVADGVSEPVERRERLGLAVVPQVAEYIGRLIIQHAS
jgi:DNA (cytosine-5)-methyltransferase 1